MDARLSAQRFLGDDALACDGSDDFNSCDGASQCSDASQPLEVNDVDANSCDASDIDDNEYDYEDDVSYDDDDDAASTGSRDSELQTSSPLSSAGGHRIQSWSLDAPALEALYHKRLEAVSDQTCLTLEHAGMLLRRFKWNTDTALEEWYNQEDSMQRWLGLSAPSKVAKRGRQEKCGICLEKCKDPVEASCHQHRFCRSCWTEYIDSAVASGTECLSLRCPARENGEDAGCCPAAVEDAMILRLANPSMQALFMKRRLQSMVDADKQLKWCTYPGCSFVIKTNSVTMAPVEVSCLAGHASCWSCGSEPHAPVGCEDARQWRNRVSCEGEEISLTLELIKECPSCHVLIEKVGGCSEVECQCQHVFCWDCGKPMEGDSHNCSAEELDGPDMVQLKQGRSLVGGRADGFGESLIHWMECESSQKAVEAALVELRGEQPGVTSVYEAASAISSLEHLVKLWQALKWRGVQSFHTSEEDLRTFLQQQLAHGKACVDEMHAEAMSGVQQLKGSITDLDVRGWVGRLANLEARARTYCGAA